MILYHFEKRILRPDCIILLSALAQVGHNSPDLIAYAFRSGLFRLPGGTSQTLPKEPVNYTLDQVGDSLKRLELATPKLKQSVVDACAYRTPKWIYKISWGDGEMGRWGDGEMGRWGDEGYFYTFFPILFREIMTPVSCLLSPVS